MVLSNYGTSSDLYVDGLIAPMKDELSLCCLHMPRDSFSLELTKIFKGNEYIFKGGNR